MPKKIQQQEGPEPEPGGDGGDEPIATLYDAQHASEIKELIRNTWGTVKSAKGMKQEDLAKALGTTQSAVSKLLNKENSHFWTPEHIKRFAKFTNRPVRTLVPESVRAFVEGWGEPELDEGLLDLCRSAIETYFRRNGKTIDPVKLNALAARLSVSFEGSHATPSEAEFNQAIIGLLMEEVAGTQ